jgi:hypothetical protein
MTKNPIINAFSATLYIVVVVSLLFYFSTFEGMDNTILIPITILSLFVLSAAVMGYIFVYNPLQLFLEGKKEEAVGLFLKTVGTFALITAIIFGVTLGIFMTKSEDTLEPIPMQGKLNIEVVCQSALSYMTFPDGASADKFVEDCKEGKYPEVIERYKTDMGLGDGAEI